MAYELDREGFTAWLKTHKDKGTKYIGAAGMVCGCPLSEYLTNLYQMTFDVSGNHAHAIGVKGALITLPGWAKDFIRIVDTENDSDITPRIALDALGRIRHEG